MSWHRSLSLRETSLAQQCSAKQHVVEWIGLQMTEGHTAMPDHTARGKKRVRVEEQMAKCGMFCGEQCISLVRAKVSITSFNLQDQF